MRCRCITMRVRKPPSPSPSPLLAMSASRRAFLGTSLFSLAASQLQAAEPAPAVRPVDDAPFNPNTLFLTWQRDPTTTMTIQWIGTVGETADTQIYYSPAA